MKRYSSVWALVIVIAGLVFCLPQLSGAAKMKIREMDYSALWKSYKIKDADLDPAREYPYESCFKEAAELYDVPVTLLLAMARGESDFNPRAKSSKSCYGIMQIQWPGTARDLGLNSIAALYDPCKNIKAGARYIKKMIDRYGGDYHLAIAAYNYGPGRIAKNARPWSIPNGANWYSGYVYHHLQQVLAGASDGGGKKAATRKKYLPGTKIPVILFHNPYRAKDFLAYFKEKAPNLNLDWFRTSLGETYIVLVADTVKEKERSVKKMKSLGYYLDLKKQFK